jgi:GNAT superfamily N-acetyltransferase
MYPAARRATLKDTSALVNMMEEFYAEADRALDRAWASASFSALLAAPAQGAVWILSQAGQPAGYVVLTVRFSMEYGGPDAFIDDLFVRPAFRRRGLGHFALQTLLAECRRRGVLAVHVEAGRDNAAAQALYASHGLALCRDDRQLLTVRLKTEPAG